MASDVMKAAKQLKKKIKKNEKRLSKDLASINADKMGVILKRLRASVGSLRRRAELPPEQAVVEATGRRKRKAQRNAAFEIDRAPELNEEILLQRNILTTTDTTDESADSSVESEGGESLSLEAGNDEGDLNLCLQQPRKATSGGQGVDPWWLHPEDLELRKQRSKRYFHTEKHTCELCDMRGHCGDKCPLGGPICVLCGKLGHRSHDCESVVCHACLKTGHGVRACPLAAKRRDSKCLRCGTMGHVEQDCFEKWRQFHVTTNPGSLTPVKSKQRPNRLAFCSNCAKRGHFSDACFHPRPRYHHIFSPGSSFVSSYDEQPTFASLPETPKSSKAKEKKKKRKRTKAEAEAAQAESAPLPQKAVRRACREEQEPESEDKSPPPAPPLSEGETLRVRPGSDLGEFVPLEQALQRRSPPDGAEVTKRKKTKPWKRKKKNKEGGSFEPDVGASFYIDFDCNSMEVEEEKSSRSKSKRPRSKSTTPKPPDSGTTTQPSGGHSDQKLSPNFFRRKARYWNGGSLKWMVGEGKKRSGRGGRGGRGGGGRGGRGGGGGRGKMMLL